jgi:DNA-binding NarL/FixJ family response regulator
MAIGTGCKSKTMMILPQETPRSLHGASDSQESFADEVAMRPKRVLVADDLESVRSAVGELLRGSFEVVAMVSDGKAALDAVLALKPDLIVLDISMPGLSGLDVAKELKSRANRTKIVFLTVHEDSRIVAACLSAGASAYVVKELMASDLIPAMNEALAGRVFVSRLSV